MSLRNRFRWMMMSTPLKAGIQMPLPIAVNVYRELARPRTMVIRNRRRTILRNSRPLAMRLLKFLGLRKVPASKLSPKVAVAIRRARAMTAITPQEYLF
jgi:hypothetical protein